MSDYFQYDNQVESFQAFSTSHTIALLLIFMIIILIYVYKKELRKDGIRIFLATLLLGQEILLHVWWLQTGSWSITDSLPLHLCSASVILSAFMLYLKSKRIYQVVYFWGLGGASQALLTPSLFHAYPHFRFFQFFTAHGLIMIAILFMTFVYAYRPTIQSVFRTFWLTNLFALFVGAVNFLIDGNYLFICRKPETASLLDLLGPWPWYLLSLEFITLLFFFLLYTPFIFLDMFNKKTDRRGE